MNGFKAYKYYMALKLHFSSPKFDVFVNRGHIRGTYDKFLMRNDRMLFEKLARQYPVDKDFIQYVASNFMYGNPNMIYSDELATSNYRQFIRRRQSITKVFTDDLHTIISSGAQLDFSGSKIPDVLQLFVSNKITIETMVILNDLQSIVERMRQNSHVALILSDDILRIEKSKGFVKYDSTRVLSAYDSFIEDVQQVGA